MGDLRLRRPWSYSCVAAVALLACGARTGLERPEDRPAPVVPVALSAGSSHACAVFSDGSARCWGLNDYGRLGDGTTVAASSPVRVTGLHDVASISAGAFATCAIRRSGDVACWGGDGFGELGNGSPQTMLSAPTAAVELKGDVEVKTGDFQTCGIRPDGTVQCLGYESGFDLAAGVRNATGLAMGEQVDCALLASGAVVCWGSDDFGQTGDGQTHPADDLQPAGLVSGLSDAVAVTAGTIFACALRRNGTVVCWGGGLAGVLEDGQPVAMCGTSPCSLTPRPISGLSGVAAIDAGDEHVCALLATGDVYCWGENDEGGLGDGTTTASYVPRRVAGVGPASAISAGSGFSCALEVAGSIACWGSNTFGELGDGTTADSPHPVRVRL
jgi:alpha-tubulin suppressor-like RCC1 family protein